MGGLSGARLLATLALRSLWSHKAKSLIVGSLIFFGALLVVMGTALLDSIEDSMSRSIIQSLAGHIQVYDSEARDPLALFGSGFMGADDVGQIPDVAPVTEALEGLDNVRAVVPMGIGMATVSMPEELDQVLQELRDALRDGEDETVATLVARFRAMTEELLLDYQKRGEVSSDTLTIAQAQADLSRAQTDEFWQGLETDPEMTLQWLDTRIAPLSSDSRLVYLRYLGADTTAFVKHFDRFEVIEGEAIPDAHRGVVLSERFYNQRLKHKIARDLDHLKKKRDQGLTIAEDPLLASRTAHLAGQYQRITFQLDPDEAVALEADLRHALGDDAGADLSALVQRFLEIDDANFDERFAQFYELVAPRIQLYLVGVGDVLTLRSFTRGGYLKSVNVKVWGIFRFKGLESSDMAGAQNLVDMLTFRELYGQMTAARRAELAEIREEVGIEAVAREDAEDALFGGDDEVEVAGDDDGFDEFADVSLAGQVERLRKAAAATFDPAQARRGLALNAAVLVKDPTRIAETVAAIEALSEERGLRIQATDWQTASGMVGQFITVVRVVLYVAIFIIFMVALTIINNSMLIATMERVSEIGTMRAIGAGRSFVVWMFLLETALLGALAGGLGAGAAVGVIGALGDVGLSAGGVDVLVFLFSGPRLYPSVGATQLLIGLVVVLLVSLASTLYPALIAARIQPVVAMQRTE